MRSASSSKVITMRIACIAWGSLLWKPGALKLATDRKTGGPILPLEFTRDSDDSAELAIVITEGAAPMPSYYAMLDTHDIASARAMLAEREKIDPAHPEWVGSIPAVAGGASDARVTAWLAEQDVDAVVWTALPPKFFKEEGRLPTADEAVTFLAGLTGTTRDEAKEYVQRIPDAIRTPYRVRIEQELAWRSAG